MSRMYDNSPLANLPVHNVTWDGVWDHNDMVATSKAGSSGVLLEGIVKGKARLSVSGSKNTSATKPRYYVLYTTIDKAHRRKFDDKGNELEPNFSETTKVSTGYLNSSYNVKAKGTSDILSASDVKSSLASSPVNKLLQSLPAGPANTAAVIMREEDQDKIELPLESGIRVKTVGTSPLVESLVVKDDASASRGNFTGDETMGGNWTDKIMSMKAGGDEKAQEPSEIEDDEWDD